MTAFQQYSEAGQDVFAYKVLLEGREPYEGTFLDIGCADPMHNNNTYAFVKGFGWKGVMVDYQNWGGKIREHRPCAFVHADMRSGNWYQRVKEAGLDVSKPIDYLSFDLDDATVQVIEAFPFHEARFRVITIEHDKYRFGQEAQDRIHAVLTRHGYEAICTNINIREGFPFEDWYVHPDLVDIDRARQMKCDGMVWKDAVAMFGPCV